jgi:adenylate cyclase
MDPDGHLRRAEAFRVVRQWHPAFRQVEADADYGVDLNNVDVRKDAITLKRLNGDDIRIPLDKDGNFDLADFGGSKLPPGVATKQKPFTEERVWHMGLVLAAMQLGLDLDKAIIDLPRGTITLASPKVTRVIPVDEHGYFYIDWCIPPTDQRLTKESIESLLAQNLARLQNKPTMFTNRWAGKLAVVGSSGQLGNNLTDQGATPLATATLLVGEHWNVANSLLLGRFVTRSSLATDALLIAVFTLITALYMWRFGVLASTIASLATVLGYIGITFAVYNSYRYWLPIAYPIVGAALLTYVSLVAWKVLFEQAERRRITSVFGTVVSTKIMDELLASGHLSVGGVRREITVMFADVRGFTELTDRSQESALDYVRKNKLTGRDAESLFDQRAAETLETVNTYLGVVADTVITHDATLDKFIGDCVMCFWGAPLPMLNHATACVQAAIAAQRAVADLNREREAENRKRETENTQRTAVGQEPLPILPVLMLGTGINTGIATAGLMGSAAKTKNYTVFGREVNLASRLESLSGRGHIYIAQTTYEHLQRDDPALAKTCIELPPQRVKGISSEVKVFEVPWEPTAAQPTT